MGRGGRRRHATAVPYGMMSVDAISALPVATVAAPAARLFLWSTRRLFREGIAAQVARAWGFTPVGEIVWGLRNPGLGRRPLVNDHEPCLIAERGPVAPMRGGDPIGVYFWRQVYEYGAAGVPQKRHSAKPPGFLELVERLSPGPYLELFAREQRLGWDTYGDEAFGHVSLTLPHPELTGDVTRAAARG